MDRRAFLRIGLLTAGAVAVGACASGSDDADSGQSPPSGSSPRPERSRYGGLRAPDADGLALPDGFTGRVVARTGQAVPSCDYPWHMFPDGGAVFAAAGGGWIYVSNSEVPGDGGVGALRFDRDGDVVDAYSILTGTNLNCAGGATPWGTWLSCEELDVGRVWECDPTRPGQGIARPSLGTFEHEAVAVADGRLYLTEDVEDGALYRFTPSRPRDLTAGTLEVAVVDRMGESGGVRWIAVPEPNPDVRAGATPTRAQVADATKFNGGEGICAEPGRVYMTTKGDNRVWRLELEDASMHVHYDAADHADPVLRGVDNVTIAPNGELYVVEDDGNMEVVLVGTDGATEPVIRVEGQDESELTGPAFDPSGRRLYFSSQQGGDQGLTYEVTGPFRGFD